MELRVVDYKDLYFPRQEWKWLREPVHFPSSPENAPDAFLWAAQVGNQLWAWHPRGAGISTGFGGMRVRVLVLRTDASETAAHGLYLKTSFTALPAQDVEWVSALEVFTSRLNGKLESESKRLPLYWKEAFQACGLEPHFGVLGQRLRYKFLTEQERKLLFEKRWDLSTFEILETVKPEIRQDFILAIRRWNLSANQTKEASTLLILLLKKLGEGAAKKVLRNPFNSAEQFRATLLATAQPELASLSNKRIEMLRGLHLPPRSSVYGDPSFERDGLKITHAPRNMSDFEAFKTWIIDPELETKLRALLEIYQ